MKSFRLVYVAFVLLSYFIPVYSGGLEEYQKASEYLSRKGEVYFSFIITSRSQIDSLTSIISIDNIKNNFVTAYANKKGFNKFLEYKLDYQILPHPGEQTPNPGMNNDPKSKAWDAYPTYTAYVTTMQQFVTQHPSICQLVEYGQTVQGRRLLSVKISDNVNTTEPSEPRFLYSSTMHGDEVNGYVLMLHLIDSLLTGYATTPDVRNFVNSAEIWIVPLLNPDGTYAGGDTTVTGATRFNGNSIDLNRNYPNPRMGEHTDGEQYQLETVAFMNFAAAHNFTMSANFHGGAELLNYPWDTWISTDRTHADDSWWQYVCRMYADTVHRYSIENYLTDQNNGISNGGDWYIAFGSQQDYMNYYHHCREVTIEISDEKTPSSSQLQSFWNYNRRSLFQFMQHCTKGISGRITDAVSGLPLNATVRVLNHDRDNSQVIAQSGVYFRPIDTGTYTLSVECTGYIPKIIPNINITPGSIIIQNASLSLVKTSDKLALSGTITDAAGNLVGSSGSVALDATVRLFTRSTGGTAVYTEQFTAAQQKAVIVSRGNFFLQLGTGQTTENLAMVISTNLNLWVEITIGTDVLSRVPLTSAPMHTTR